MGEWTSGARLGYLWIAATVVLTVYGQLVFKWQIDEAGTLPEGTRARAEYVLDFVLDPWMITVAIAVLAAGVAWALALTRLDLSHAYPFMSLSFVFVLVFSALLFNEALTGAKAIGIVLIGVGLWVGSSGG